MQISKFLQKNKLEICIISGAIIAYFISRLITILALPIFTDEAIYIRWAQIANNDPSWRFISLTDGKQPMFVWIAMITSRLVEDPLLAGRLVSVGAGFVSLIGMFFLGKELFKNHWIGVLSLVFYVLFPFALVYDRMALYDSLVGMFTIWSLYLVILLVRRVRLDIALLTAIVIGGGVLTKSNAFFSLALLPVTLILFDLDKRKRFLRLAKWVLLAGIVIVLSLGYYSILRLSPYFNIIDEKNHLFVYSFNEWKDYPLRYFVGNWKGLWDWFTTYLTYPLLFVVLASFVVNKKYSREKLFIILWCLIPFVYIAFFGKTLYPRFIFFMTLPLIPLIAFTFYYARTVLHKNIFYALVILCALLPFRSNYYILFDFHHAPIADPDIGQYSRDWPAGWGVTEAVSFFKKEAKKEKIFIATQGTFGLMPYALEIYLVTDPNVRIVGFWPTGNVMPKEVREASKKVPTYVVFYQNCTLCLRAGEAPVSWPLTLVSRIDRPSGTSYLSIYKVNP